MRVRKSEMARTELVRAFRERYRSASRKGKRVILDELIALTGYGLVGTEALQQLFGNTRNDAAGNRLT